MAIRLVELFDARSIDLGYGVSVRVRPIGYADLKAAEASALRRARERKAALLDAPDAVAQDAADNRSSDDEMLGLAEELLLDEMVHRFVESWDGVLDEDGLTPAPLTPATWRKFRQGVPMLADVLRAALRRPVDLVVCEGKPSAL